MCGHERMNIEMLDKKVKNVDKIHLSKQEVILTCLQKLAA